MAKRGPEPFKGSGADIDPAAVVLQRPECAALIGAIAVEWVHMETVLARIYSYLVNGVNPFGRDLGEVIAAESFDLVPSLQVKRTILLAAARRRFDNDLVDRFAGLLKQYQEAATKRNDIIHGTWLLSDEYPDKLIWSKPITQFAKARVYGVVDFKAILESIEQVAKQFDALFRDEMSPILEAAFKVDLLWLADAQNVKDSN